MPAPRQTEPRFIRAKDCAKILNISLRRFYELLHLGQGPRAQRLGMHGVLLINRENFEKWVEALPDKKPEI